MPWRARSGRNSGLVIFFNLSLGVVVSCTTISVAAPAGSTGDSAVPLTAAAGSPSPAAVPTPGATPVASATAIPSATAAPSPSPSPTLLPTAAPPSAAPSTLTAVASPSAAPLGQLTRLDRRTRTRIKSVLTKWVKEKGVAGLSVAVGLPDGETWTAVAGSAEFSPLRKVQDDTVFAVASVTKTFTAALILRLVEEGKLSLDETFGTYAPDTPRGRSVTIRQLLSHTSGIYNYFENPKYLKVFKDREHRWTYEEIIDLVKGGYCKPGTCYHYSNTNFVILGKIAEVAGGAPLHKQFQQQFFGPLGMDDTIYQPDDRTPVDAAHGHWSNLSGGHIDHTRTAQVIPFMAAASVASSAGAIASTASDLATWARALYGGEILSRKSLREMTTFLPQGTYGLGTDVASFAGVRAWGHRGGLRGYESSMWYFPREGVSIVMLSNQGNWLTDAPFDRIAKAVFKSG